MTTAGEFPVGKRVLAGWLLTPLISIPFFKAAAVFAIPATCIVTLPMGSLILRYCYRRNWLQWWHALIAGWLAGMLVAVMYLGSIDRLHVAIHGPTEFVVLQSYGAAVGLCFWAIAIFRNPQFPQTPTNGLLLVLCTGTLAALVVTCVDRLEVQEIFGRIAATPASARVTLVLGNGTSVTARIRDGDLKLPESREVGAYTRLGALSEERLYWINGMCKDPPDGRIVPCDFDKSYLPPPPRVSTEDR